MTAKMGNNMNTKILEANTVVGLFEKLILMLAY